MLLRFTLRLLFRVLPGILYRVLLRAVPPGKHLVENVAQTATQHPFQNPTLKPLQNASQDPFWECYSQAC